MATLPKYTDKKRKGNIGEALIQYILSDFCLVHKIDGSNDIGNDFICELIKEKSPTNLLFYVQVKFCETAPSIRPETKEYWKGSQIPVYLFWVKPKKSRLSTFSNPSDFDCLYKRYTPKVHNPSKYLREPYKKYDEFTFKKDLVKDYARSQYVKGLIPIIEPRDFLSLDDKLLTGLARYAIFYKDIIPEYSQPILKRSWVSPFITAILLAKDGGSKLVDSLKAIDLAQRLLQLSEDKDKAGFQYLIQAQREIIYQKMRDSGLEDLIN